MEDDDDPPYTTIVIVATTKITSFYLFFLMLASLSHLSSADDGAVMMKIFRSLYGPPGWYGSNFCKWQGVSCDSLGHVTDITLSYKSVSGTLPPELSQLASLKSLSLQSNRISGIVPSFANMSALQGVFLDHNKFTGVASPLLAGLPNLQSFSIEDNPLEPWTLPTTLADSGSIQEFRASNASVVGPIPDIFGSLPSLQTLALAYNDLNGSLPTSFAGSNIQKLDLSNQKRGLTGRLDVLSQMTGLDQVWLQDNDFTGPIPDMSNCTSLFDLQLRDNQLTGIVPSSISNLPNLMNITLQNNMLQGPIPDFKSGVQVILGPGNSFCNAKPGPCNPQVTTLLDIAGAVRYPAELAQAWKGNNPCNQWAHVTCDTTGAVTVVNLARQSLSGFISPSFANLTSLTSILLNDNNLVGTIPDRLTSLTKLTRLDLSNNNLTGKLPNFPSRVTVNTNGNPFLGTSVNTAVSMKSPPGALKTTSKTHSSGSKLSSYEILAIVLSSLILLIALAALAYQYIVKKRHTKYSSRKDKHNGQDYAKTSHSSTTPGETPSDLSGTMNGVYAAGNMIPIEILREVTNNFSEENILGRGGFGVVYKGVLHDGTQIAVKRMEFGLQQGSKGLSEFEAEIVVLTKVRHRHLVALLGYCVNGNERIVVYENMPQGTLAQHLFECDKRGRAPLTWKQRLVIALDVARGVEYLHSLAQQSFIHRDLKPSNILLGDDMRAKVSDFGLVKNAPDGKYSIETRLAGTFGYLAPEYAATGRVTTKIDVFAFGVVLMEIVTGRKALDETLPEDRAQLVTWFRRILINKDSIRKAMDPYLDTEDEETFNSVCKVAELAGHCTARDPNQRPDMGHAVNVLSPLVGQWRPTTQGTNDDEDDDVLDSHMSLPEALQRWRAGETSIVSDHTSNSFSRNYNSTAPTTPSGINDSFTSVGR